MMRCTVRKTGGPAVIPSAARNLALVLYAAAPAKQSLMPVG